VGSGAQAVQRDARRGNASLQSGSGRAGGFGGGFGGGRGGGGRR